MDKEIRADTGLVRILRRPAEGETVRVLQRRLAYATLGDLVQVRNCFLEILETNYNNCLSVVDICRYSAKQTFSRFRPSSRLS